MSIFSNISAAIGRLFKQEAPDGTVGPVTEPADASIHPGLTDQQLVVLLTAAAYEVVASPVRIERFRPFTAKDWSWAAQGRSELHSHRLK